MAPMAECGNRSYLFVGPVHIDASQNPQTLCVASRAIAEDVKQTYASEGIKQIDGDGLGAVYINGQETKGKITLPENINIAYKDAP